ncbi:hypothetical protein JFL43_19800 [Viridibacillus sp. YIM B01967]|uniref:Uncharacterized protein n=1 Tax=Viridibacillus soli TaxID=2798301 RepID=A0ABS1HC97_9BACL|nr:hypothetical protein [Viridibacillus soli]MBK3497038.1 hypothetical protein [Viridibacillus soli]
MGDIEKEARLQQAMDDYGDYIVQLCYTYVRDWGACINYFPYIKNRF